MPNHHLLQNIKKREKRKEEENVKRWTQKSCPINFQPEATRKREDDQSSGLILTQHLREKK